MVQTAETDVERPAVAAQDPDALADQRSRAIASRLRASEDSLPASLSRNACTLFRCAFISVSVFCDDVQQSGTQALHQLPRASRVTSVSANSFC